MISWRNGIAGLAIGLSVMSIVASSSAEPDAGLIPRKILFGNAERGRVRLSPDGQTISFLAPKDGVQNIWVASAKDPDHPKAITNAADRDLGEYYWAQNSKNILYLKDQGGDENYQLYSVAIADGKSVALTAEPKARAEIVADSVKLPSEILIGLNNRDAQWHDVWRVNIETGKRTLAYQNSGYGQFYADDDLNLRYAVKPMPDGSYAVERADGKGGFAAYMTIPAADSLGTSLLGLDRSGKILYAIDSIGRDKAALVSLDAKTAAPHIIGESQAADVGNTLADPRTGVIQAYSVELLKTEWFASDPAIKADIDFLNAHAAGQWEVKSRTLDDRTWLVYQDTATEAGFYSIYDRIAHTLTKSFSLFPKLAGRTLAPMQALTIKSRDGLDLVSYLTLPAGADKNGDGKPDAGALPTVLFVHGGPWGRDEYGYNPYHQWLANRGYAVLSVNFRASTGFGKAFVNAGDKQWGRAMQDDLDDAVAWAVKSGVAKADKVAIFGGSYGGYATLAGITMRPKQFACGVDLFGPSNLQTLLSTIPPYWKAQFEEFARRIGDPRTPEGQALLKERSPLTYAGQIARPLLIGQGANDARVKEGESGQIVAAMQAKHIPVTYVLYSDEGHGFVRPADNTSFNAIAEAFLAKCLGGKYEPIGDDFIGAKFEVRAGAENIPGVAEALKH